MDGISTATPIRVTSPAPAPKKKAPRAAASYRGARRNAARAAGGLAEWRSSCLMAIAANQKANLEGRQVASNGAREAGARAIIEAQSNPRGLPGHIVHASAVLDFYREQRRTRVVNRIIRGLEKQVRS